MYFPCLDSSLYILLSAFHYILFVISAIPELLTHFVTEKRESSKRNRDYYKSSIVSLIRYIFFYILLLMLIDWVTEQSLGGPGTAFINFYCISFFSSVNVVLKTSLFRPRLYINLTQMIKPVWYRERNIRRTVAIATVDKKKNFAV